MKNLLVGLVIASIVGLSFNAMAEGDKAAAGNMSKLELTGKLILKEDIKGEVKATDKVGKTEETTKIKATETIVSKYALVEADGTEIALPEPKANVGEQAVDLAALVGKNVKIVAKGKMKTVEGKKQVIVKSIVSAVEEAAAAPAAAPAADAAAPAAK